MSTRRIRIIGWRERVALPELGVDGLEAKIDTGARTSALHAFDIAVVEGRVRFRLIPGAPICCEAELLGVRKIRSSTGQLETRPYFQTTLALAGLRWPIEITLTDRATLSHPLLLGRMAVRARFLVDPSRAYVQSDRW